jgi:hypothetical protein
MMAFGLYDVQAGGFIDTQIWSRGEAIADRRVLIEAGEYETEADLDILEMCPDHDEQARETCEECAADGAESDEDDD